MFCVKGLKVESLRIYRLSNQWSPNRCFLLDIRAKTPALMSSFGVWPDVIKTHRGHSSGFLPDYSVRFTFPSAAKATICSTVKSVLLHICFTEVLSNGRSENADNPQALKWTPRLFTVQICVVQCEWSSQIWPSVSPCLSTVCCQALPPAKSDPSH